MSELERLHGTEILRGGQADVAHFRERARLRRIRRLTIGLWAFAIWMALRLMWGVSLAPSIHISSQLAPSLMIVGLLGAVLLVPMWAAGRSPHVLYRPTDIDTGLDDVVGCEVVREEVVRTLNLFLANETVREQLGATPRRGVLFEGPPGTGKTHIAKAMAREAGVPFLFVSSSAFQSMYYGQTNRKIRAYFRALRAMARHEGGAIGFIEEIDAIGGARSGMGSSTSREGISGVVNELLIQLQSFDEPTTSDRFKGWFVERLNVLLPEYLRVRKPRSACANVLVVAATNRAADLDPALLRPGRFDRTISFDLPGRSERRELIDYFLARKAHDEALDGERARDDLAAVTAGYSPVMIEHLFDEALVWALRRGASALSERDLQQAKLTEELGLQHPITYSDAERLAVATHEAGHATIAFLCGRDDDHPSPLRRLEVLSIVKRRGSLGVLGHNDDEERWTKSKSELLSLIRISFGGMVAEELAFGESGTGPSADLTEATRIAATMVGALGMGHTLLSLANGGDVVAKVLDDDASRAATEAILDQAKADATHLLQTHRVIHSALRDALLEREELVGEEILDVIRAAILRDELTEIDLRDEITEVFRAPRSLQ
ncbi:MAG TPA: AAA family ATPase [Acidimicrobiales bacterium]|nr:AAA family ATPase [Acidimicrobiales bacterium]